MGLNDTPAAERVHIGFFGMRNAGKSSLVNAVTGQNLSVVSDVKGTTTDPVKKAMDLKPLGPAVIIDTPARAATSQTASTSRPQARSLFPRWVRQLRSTATEAFPQKAARLTFSKLSA